MESSVIIVVGGTEYPVPRSVSAEGGDAVESWLAAQLLAAEPGESISNMTRAELEAEARRLGLATALPDGVPLDDTQREFLVLPEPGKQLTNADFRAAIDGRRTALAAIVPPPTPEGEFDAVPVDGGPILTAEGDPS